ncbi:MAG TPA: PD-(D/E)XK nuclease family protein [Ignavibacteria bacterium]
MYKRIFNGEIDNTRIKSIKKEKDFGKGGRIDIEIIGNNWILAIENKIKSHEKNNQTNKYEKYYDKFTKSKGISKNNLFLIYLTPNGEKATSDIFKSATYKQIREIIEELKSDFNDEAKIDSEFNNICNEMGFKSIESKKLKRSFARYRRQRISNRSSFQIDTTKFFVNEIESNINLGIKDMNKLIENIQKVIPTKIRDQFSTEEEITTTLICEYIMVN